MAYSNPFKSLLGAFTPQQPDPYQSLLGDYYDPKREALSWLGGNLAGVGMGLASGKPGAWATGGIAGGQQGIDDYQRQAVAGYAMNQRKKEYDYQQQQREEEAAARQAEEEAQAAAIAGMPPEMRTIAEAFPSAVIGPYVKQKYFPDPVDNSDSWRYASPEEKQQLGVAPDAPLVITKSGPKLISTGAPTINVNGGASETKIWDTAKEQSEGAKAAQRGLSSLSQAQQALPGAITGAAADQRLALQKVATLFGADPSSVVNTETFRSAIAPQVAAMLKATVGSTQISNADREFAEKAAAGSIQLDSQSINRLINIMQAANSETIRGFRGALDQVYPDGQGFDRERALLQVPNVDKRYASPIGPGAPAISGPIAPNVRKYNQNTGRIE